MIVRNELFQKAGVKKKNRKAYTVPGMSGKHGNVQEIV